MGGVTTSRGRWVEPGGRKVWAVDHPVEQGRRRRRRLLAAGVGSRDRSGKWIDGSETSDQCSCSLTALAESAWVTDWITLTVFADVYLPVHLLTQIMALTSPLMAKQLSSPLMAKQLTSSLTVLSTGQCIPVLPLLLFHKGWLQKFTQPSTLWSYIIIYFLQLITVLGHQELMGYSLKLFWITKNVTQGGCMALSRGPSTHHLGGFKDG